MESYTSVAVLCTPTQEKANTGERVVGIGHMMTMSKNINVPCTESLAMCWYAWRSNPNDDKTNDSSA